MGVTNIANRWGKYGTRYFIGCWTDDIELLIFIENILLNKKFINHKRGTYFSSIFCNLSSIVLKLGVSNADNKSSRISYWVFLLSSVVYMLSKSKSRVVSVLYTYRKLFCLLSSKKYVVCKLYFLIFSWKK